MQRRLFSAAAAAPRERKPLMVSRIILLRHGESLGNLNDFTYVTTPDWKIPLTATGVAQSTLVGARLREMIGAAPVYVYVSPYLRTRQTLEHAAKAFDPGQVVAVREEPRISEQQFGNFQVCECMCLCAGGGLTGLPLLRAVVRLPG